MTPAPRWPAPIAFGNATTINAPFADRDTQSTMATTIFSVRSPRDAVILCRAIDASQRRIHGDIVTNIACSPPRCRALMLFITDARSICWRADALTAI